MKRYKISRIRPEIDIDEAGTMANFDQLVKTHITSAGAGLNYWRIARISAIMVATAGLVYFAVVNDSYTLDEHIPIISAKEAPVEPPLSSAELDVTDPESEEESTEEVTEAKQEPHENHEAAASQEEPLIEENNVRSTGYVEAEPLDGFPALYSYFDENLEYPDEILKDGVQGSVIVRFDIDTAGMPINIAIEKSLHQRLDSTAMRLIEQMPHWHSAKLYGRPIVSTHRIPLFFKIDEPAN